jgi:hypothetical protein
MYEPNLEFAVGLPDVSAVWKKWRDSAAGRQRYVQLRNPFRKLQLLAPTGT